MNTKKIFIPLLVLALLLASCSLLSNAGVTIITPSTVVISENRNVSGFSAINFSTVGKVNIIQGDTESLNISGSDNVVPQIITTVTNGTLYIKTNPGITFGPFVGENTLTFTIVVKDLTSLNNSGLGDIQIETLSTPSMDINMSGAGKITQNQLTTNTLNLALSGLGGIDISGQASQATINLSGAGSVNAADLQIQNANVTISGLGGATLWVTGQLTGDISGTGSISYYGNPQTNTKSSGLGSFKSLGNK